MFAANMNYAWNDEDLCLYLGYGSSLGNYKIETQLLDLVIGNDGKHVHYNPPFLGQYFEHLECAGFNSSQSFRHSAHFSTHQLNATHTHPRDQIGLSDVKCMTPDLSAACLDAKSCKAVEHMVETCAQCYQQTRATYLRYDFPPLYFVRLKCKKLYA